jgi:glutaredoxin
MEFVIYGKDNCFFCALAQRLLIKKGFNFQYLTLGKDYSKEELLDLFPTAKTVPQIVYNQDDITAYVGGYDDLITFIDSISWESKLIEDVVTGGELSIVLDTGTTSKIKFLSQIDDGLKEVRVLNIETGEPFNLKYDWVRSYDILEPSYD